MDDQIDECGVGKQPLSFYDTSAKRYRITGKRVIKYLKNG